MIAAPARDDLLLLRLADHVVVIAHQLELGLVGITAGHAVIDLGHVGAGQLENLLGQRDLRLIRVADIGVVVAELEGLLVDGISDFRAPVTDVDAVEAGEAIDQLTPVTLADADAFATGDHAARCIALGVIAQVGRGMEGDLAITANQLIGRGRVVEAGGLTQGVIGAHVTLRMLN